ncbi:MAG: hypothetical protein K9N55_05585 [Phycisphaerae bacterium]|nr:hypothetical protein [Phycisphaerae bacterium]
MTHQKQPGRRGLKKRTILLVLCLGGLAAFGVFRFHVHNQLMQRIEALQAQGYPMSLLDMDAWYQASRPEDVNNAWPVYLSAFQALVTWDKQADANLPGYGRDIDYQRGEAWTPLHLQQAKAYLKDNDACLDLLYDGAGYGPCFRPLDFSRGHAMELPWLSETRDCARLMRLASRVASQQGDVDGAVRAIEMDFVLADSLKAPLTVINLVKTTIWRLGIESIEGVLNDHALTQEQLQALEARLEPIESIDCFKQSLIGERCFTLQAFNANTEEMIMLSSSNESGDLWPLAMIPRKLLGLHDLDGLSYINVTQASIEALSLPRAEARVRLRAVQAEHQPRLGMLARIFCPALNRFYALESRVVANSLCARTALAVERLRLATGQVPDTLDSLVPTYMASVPLDPFDGQPLRFRRLDKGYVVYSVGEDLEDNQGEERKTGKASKEQTAWDETFIVAR